jgi:TetR/AcrR family transcriptional regulator
MMDDGALLLAEARPLLQPSSPKGEATLKRILEAAEHLFARKGFAATRMQDIADAVDIKRASIAYFFPDKQRIYLTVIRLAAEELRETVLTRLPAEGGPLERLQLSFETWIRHLAERPNLFRIILRQMSGEEGPSGVETLAWNAGLSLQQELLDEAKLAYKRPNLTIDQLNAAACGPTFVFLAIAFNRPDFDSADPAFQAQLDQHIDEIKATLQRLLAA